MDAFRCILGLGPKRRQPCTYETDQIYPVYASDDTKIYRKLMLNWTLRFDDVLEYDMLQSSLHQLLVRGNWRKLGGRLRLNAEGKLELHVPKEFSVERPAVRFSHQVFDVAIEEHSLARQLPKARPEEHEISRHAGPLQFRAFGARADAPQCLEDLLHSDEPQLAIHVTSFTDATLLGLLWPHTMTGAMGLSALMEAWSLALGDRLAEVPELEGVWDDPLGKAEAMAESAAEEQDKEEPYVLASKQLHGLKLLRAGLNYAWSTHTRPKRELEMVYLPSRFVSQLRLRAHSELKDDFAETPFISDGDLICAWATQLVARDRRRGLNRAILSLNTFDVRSRLPSVFKPDPAASAYVQNTAFGVISLFSAREAIDDGFGRAAYKYRQDIVEQTTEAQVLGQLRCARAAEKSGKPAVFGDATAAFLVITNWSKAKFHEVIDFSPAVVAPTTTTTTAAGGAAAAAAAAAKEAADPKRRKTPPGKLVYQHSEAITTNPTAGNVCVILGKDLEGGYWIATSLLPGASQGMARPVV